MTLDFVKGIQTAKLPISVTLDGTESSDELWGQNLVQGEFACVDSLCVPQIRPRQYPRKNEYPLHHRVSVGRCLRHPESLMALVHLRISLPATPRIAYFQVYRPYMDSVGPGILPVAFVLNKR